MHNLSKYLQNKDLGSNIAKGYAGQYLSELFQYNIKAHDMKAKIAQQKSKGQTIKESIDKGMNLTSSILHEHSYILLRTKILDIAKAKIDANAIEKRN